MSSLLEQASICITPNGVKAGKLYGLKGTDLDVVRATTATRVNAEGLIETVANNVPRLDYTGGSCPSILVEPQRTNLLFPSEVATTQSRTVTATAHTLSFYGTGTVVLSGVAIATLVGTGVNNRVTLTFTPTAGVLILTIVGSVNKWQLEEGSNATSYIPTVATTSTRNADVISKTGIADLIGTEFTFFLEGKETIGGNSTRYSALKGSGTTYENLLIIEANASNQIAVNLIGIFFGITVPLINGERFKLAVRCKNNDFAFYLNGFLIQSQLSGTVPILSDLYFGNYFDYSENYNIIKSLAIWKKGLTNSQLATLTTL